MEGKQIFNGITGAKIQKNDPIFANKQAVLIITSKGASGTFQNLILNPHQKDDCYVYSMDTFEQDFAKTYAAAPSASQETRNFGLFSLKLLFSHCKALLERLRKRMDAFGNKIYHFLANLRIEDSNISHRIQLIISDV